MRVRTSLGVALVLLGMLPMQAAGADEPGGSITIVKDTVPDNHENFAFTTTGGLSPDRFTLDDDLVSLRPNTQVFTNLAPGIYTVTEQPPPDDGGAQVWTLTNLFCTDASGGTLTNLDSRTATIDLAAGESVTCTFTNSKVRRPQSGSITIIKDAIPDGPQTFGFGSTGGLPLPTFSLADDPAVFGANNRVFANLGAGTYTVTEAETAGWNLTNVVCTDPTGGTASNLGARTASIDLAAGEHVVCTFTNAQIPAPSPSQSFEFTTGGLESPTFALGSEPTRNTSAPAQPPAAPSPPQTLTELPRTGGAGSLAVMGFAFLAAGFLLVATARRWEAGPATGGAGGSGRRVRSRRGRRARRNRSRR